MAHFSISRNTVNFNECGYFLTFYWRRDIRLFYVHFKPVFWKSTGWRFCRHWTY